MPRGDTGTPSASATPFMCSASLYRGSNDPYTALGVPYEGHAPHNLRSYPSCMAPVSGQRCSFSNPSSGIPSQVNTRRSEMVLGEACRSSSKSWLVEEPVSGYTAPRPPMYASVVSLGEGGRPLGYYTPQVTASLSPVGLRGQLGTRAFVGSSGNHIYLRNLNFLAAPILERHMSRPRSRRTVCLGGSFSLPTLHEDDADCGPVRSASLLVADHGIPLTTQKVNNIEKAEKMKAQNIMKVTEDELLPSVEIHRSVKYSQMDKAAEVSRSSLRTKGKRKCDPKALGSGKHVSFSEPPAKPPSSLSASRVRLSYVESVGDADKSAERPSSTKKRLSWAAGEIHKASPPRPQKFKAVLNNEIFVRRGSLRSRPIPSEGTTLFPRTESCINIPKCKRRLSWATSEKKRFSWSPRGTSACLGGSRDKRRYSFAGKDTMRSSIRMGTRSLVSISSPVTGSLVHLAGPGPHSNVMLAAIVDHHSHNRQETTLVHPVTQKSVVRAEAIHSPPPAVPRFEAAPPTTHSNTLNNNETRKGVGRRRLGGSWVKTPGLRRPQVSAVTLQGWLYKQGADGLHLWKKRWFVLSEYCLYYYKGPEEEKVLGSLPLPSFKISPVDSEDRVYRKHAFKAEHQNMRTYYFAAETKDQMAHWMNALSLASILQKDTSLEEKWSSGSSARRSERPSVSSLASTASPSADESDSGFHGYRSRRYRSPDGRSLDEASESSRVQGDRLNTSCDSSVILRPGDRQPLYANAPPKPKRLNTSRDYSTSPERSPERDERDPRTYTDHGGGGNGTVEPRNPDGRGLHYHPPAAERRTPDAYGVTAGGGRGDYEDVYGDSNGSNSVPHSPVRRPEQRDSFASSRSGGTRLSEELQLSEPLRSNFCRQDDTLPRVSHPEPHHCRRPTGPPRPHSADFLDYDRRHGSSNMWSYRRGSGGDLPRHEETRPKSSVGQNESDHWSEENYAQKMRQSSLYHSHMHSRSSARYSPAGRGESPGSDHHHLHTAHVGAPQRVPPAGAATPDLYTSHKPSTTPTPASATNSLRRGAAQDLKEIPRQDTGQEPWGELRQYSRRAPTQDGRQDRRLDTRQTHRQDSCQDPRRVYNHEDPLYKHEISPNTTLTSVPTPPGSYPNSASPNGSVNNSFMRSASARLPRHPLQDDMMNTSLPDDGSDGDSKKMQQREESMKRLLEWKQRMLQSPLTRKSTSRPDSTATPQPRSNNEAYRQQVLNELVIQEARTKVIQCHSHTQSLLPGMESGLNSPVGSVVGISHGYSGSTIPAPLHGSANTIDWVPGNHTSNKEPLNYGSVNQGGLSAPIGVASERPAPQGGSSHQGSDSSSTKRREGRRENSRTRHVSGGDSRRSTSASRYNSYSSDEDDVKVGESLPRRSDPNAPNSSGPQGSTHAHPHAHQKYQHHPHAHHQNYQHHPHPHSQNQYHHYKSDDLHNKYQVYPGQNYQSNGPYTNYPGNQNYPHGYSEDHNYPNNYKQAPSRPPNYQESQQPLPANPNGEYNTLNSQSARMNGTYRPNHYDFQDYHNFKNHQQDYKNHQQDYKNHQQDYKNHQQDYKTLDYGTTYGRHHDQRLNGRPPNDIHQQQFSDSELTVSKPRARRALSGRAGGGVRPASLHTTPQHTISSCTTNTVPYYHHHHHHHLHHQQPAAAPQENVEVRGLQGVSAGELLGKTHEELVLLLIQLRRHHSALQSARHHARLERDSQARLAQLDGEHRDEHLRRLTSLNHHLHDLDKQYEMGKPLINLVDNMVKLGSLYRGGDSRLNAQHDPRRPRSYYQANGYDSLQFSRRIQERRIVAEDLQLQEYELAAADQADLEGKVMQLYKLDKNLHQESLTIQSLQREKEMLERTLVNLHSKSHGANEGPVELERRKKQRRHLEHELSKLRAHLAVSARKLEETAAENSRLEHEMMMLRQKIQMTMARNSQRESGGTSETRHIEAEMVRVQTLLEDLQRRRIELSHQIQKLTSANPGLEIRPSPTGMVGAAPVPARRRTHSTWLETDLDAMVTRDRGMDPPEDGRRSNPPVYVNATGYVGEVSPSDYPESPDFNDSEYPPPPPPPEHMRSYNQHLDGQTGLTDPYQTDLGYLHSQSSFGEPKRRQPLMNGDINMEAMIGLDRDADDNKPDGEEQQSAGHLDINDADDRMKRYYGILPKEKPLEIKTVRIVKRESTERKKDRGTGGKRVTIGDSSLTHLLEDDVESDGISDAENEPQIPSFASRSASLPRNYGRNGPGERVSMMAAMMRTSVGNAATMSRPSNLALKKSAGWKSKTENPKDRPLSAHEQLFGFARETDQTPPVSPSKSDPPSPVFKSAAAQEIIKEMASEAEKHRRAVPKEKRRHFTISSSRPITLEARDAGAEEGARSRDDCDMVRALRPRNHPDVVKSTLSTRDLRFNETTIDSVLGAPSKIYIPERYMPDEDDEKELTEEERALRELKAESIRKMLSETQTTATKGEAGEDQSSESKTTASSSSAFKAKVAAEKKEREHLLALNQILARQVMEKSRVVAAHTTVEPHL